MAKMKVAVLIISIIALSLVSMSTDVFASVSHSGTPPTFITFPSIIQIENTQVKKYHVSATDAENDPIQFNLFRTPEFMTIKDHGNGTATITAAPQNAITGSTFAYVIITSNGQSNYGEFRIFVSPMPSPPVIQFIDPVVLNDNEINKILVITNFEEDDPITITLQDPPEFVTLDDHGNGTATINISSATVDVGMYAVTVLAEANGNTYAEIFDVTIKSLFPIINQIDNQVMKTADTVILNVTTTYFENDPITLELGDAPSFATIKDHGNGTATITLKPIRGDEGDHSVTVTATVDAGKIREEFDVDVTAGMLTKREKIENFKIEENKQEKYLLDDTYTSPNEITYTGMPDSSDVAYISIEGTGMTIHTGNAGFEVGTVCADDGVDRFCQNFDINVINYPPQITNKIQNFKLTITEEAKLYLKTKFSDNDIQNYTVDTINSTVASVLLKNSVVTITALVPGNTNNTACAIDVANPPVCQHFAIQVNPDTEAPAIMPPSDKVAEAEKILTEVDIGLPDVKDNIDPDPIVANDAPDSFLLGNTIVTWNATDYSGNSASAIQIVTIEDTTPPEFGPVDHPLFETYKQEIYVDLPVPSATDVFPDVMVDCEFPKTYNIGETKITCTATDTSNNESTVMFYVKVVQENSEIRVDPDDPANVFGFGRYIERTDDSLLVSGKYRTPLHHIPAIYPFSLNSSNTDGTTEQWIGEEPLRDPDDRPMNRFARAVSFDGDTIVAVSNDLPLSGTSNNGAAYVFERNDAGKWVQEDKLPLNHLIQSTSNFRSAAIDGDTMVIGSYSTTPERLSGTVSIYERDSDGSWSLVKQQDPYVTGPYGRFGSSIDIDGDTMVIGASHANGVMPQSGAAYILEKNSTGQWTKTADLHPDDLRPGSAFGDHVSVYNNTVAIGAKYLYDRSTGLDGAAYIFEKNSAGTWQQVKKLTTGTPDHRNIGDDITVYKDTLVTTAHYSTSSGTKSMIYVYERSDDTWNKTAMIKPGHYVFSSPDSLALWQNSLLVGNPNEFVGSVKSGSLNMYLGDISSFDSPQTGLSTSGQYDPVDTTRVIADIDGVTFDPYTMEMYVENNDLEYFIYGVQNADDSAKATVDLLSEIIPESAENDITITIVDVMRNRSTHDVFA